MEKEQLSFRGACSLIIILIISNSIVLGLPGNVGQDGWISLLLTVVGVVPVTLMLARLVRLMPGQDIYAMAESVFGKIGGKIAIFLLGFYSFHLAALVLESNTQFIHMTFLFRTPMAVVTLVMLCAALYLGKCGVEVIGKWGMIVATIFLILLPLFFLLSVSDFDFRQMQPVLEHSVRDIGLSSLRMMSFPFGEAAIIMGIAGSLKKDVSPYKVGFTGLLVSGVVILTIFVHTCAVLGPVLMETAYFPAYKAASMIELGNFLERIESAVGFLYLLLGMVKAAVCIVSASRGAARLFALPSYKTLLIPIGFGAAALSLILFHNIIEQFDYWEVYKIYAVPFQLLIPLLIWITAEIRSKRGRLVPPEKGSPQPVG